MLQHVTVKCLECSRTHNVSMFLFHHPICIIIAQRKVHCYGHVKMMRPFLSASYLQILDYLQYDS